MVIELGINSFILLIFVLKLTSKILLANCLCYKECKLFFYYAWPSV